MAVVELLVSALLVVANIDLSGTLSIDRIILDASTDNMFDAFHFMDDHMMTMVELDILMNMTEFEQYKSTTAARSKRRASSEESKLWPNCWVYYEMDDRIDWTARDLRVINEAMLEWENYTCLSFRHRSVGDRIFFTTGDGCYSRLGRVGGRQPVALAPTCRQKGVVVHEIGHAIGWYHEHARPDRDHHIRVNYAQIPLRWRPQFDPAPRDLVQYLGVPYDYLSVMHYSGDGFGDRTIQTLDARFQTQIGQRVGLSFDDIKLANAMYKCGGMCSDERVKNSCPEEGFVDKNCICWCPPENDIYHVQNPRRRCPRSSRTTTTTRRPAVTTPTTMAPTPQPSCEDIRSNCSAYKERGACFLNSARMSALCAKTCGFCGTESKCMDMEDVCPLMAKGGYCDRSDALGQFLKTQCPVSCGQCSPPDPCQLRDLPGSAPSHFWNVDQVSTVLITMAVLASTML